jgi:hypothetical protein
MAKAGMRKEMDGIIRVRFVLMPLMLYARNNVRVALVIIPGTNQQLLQFGL